MKLIGAFLVVVCLTSLIEAEMDKAQMEQMAKELLTACKEQEGGTDDDLHSMLNLKFPETESAKCMMACLHEKVGFIENGKVKSDNFIGFAEKMSSNSPECVAMAAEVSKNCGSITGPRCEQALEFSKCLHAEAKARNFELPNGL